MITILSKNLQDQLTKLLNDNKKVLKLKTTSGETVEDILKSEAQRLIGILDEEIEMIYSRSSSWYARSNDLRQSVNKSISIDPRTNTITIEFLEDKAWHGSWVTKKYNPSYSNQAYAPQAVREGYEVFNSGHYVDGIDFIQNAIDKFNKVKKPGITVKIEDDAISGNWWR